MPVLPAQVVGAAGNVGQRADQVVAALERRLQQHGTHLLYLLQTHTRARAGRSCGSTSLPARIDRSTETLVGCPYHQDVVVHRSARRREVRRHRGTRSLLRLRFQPGIPKHLDVVSQHTWLSEKERPQCLLGCCWVFF